MPTGPEWLHEPKIDGYRLQCHVTGRKAVLLSRTGLDYSARFPTVAAAAVALADGRRMIIDGEVVVPIAQGYSAFQSLQASLSAGVVTDATYWVFDLLAIDRRDLRRLPLDERRAALMALLGGARKTAVIRITSPLTHAPDTLLAAACRRGEEGVMSKLRGAPYRPGRTRDWVKTKCGERDELVVIGFTEPEGVRTHFGALLLASRSTGGEALRYAGRVGTGFDDTTLAALHAKLLRLERPTAAVSVPRAVSRNVHWVEPKLVADVVFAEWTIDRLVRQATFQGLRDDKEVGDVRRETSLTLGAARKTAAKSSAAKSSVTKSLAVKSSAAKTTAVNVSGVKVSAVKSSTAKSSAVKSSAAKSSAAKSLAAKTLAASSRSAKSPPAKAGGNTDTKVAGIIITSGDRMVFPEIKLTKRGLAEFYEAAAPLILPHMGGRPLSTMRCPDGPQATCFYQKHWAATRGAKVNVVRVPEADGEVAEYAIANDVTDIMALVQMNAIEFHVWGSRADSLEAPDRLILDLDPGPGISWATLRESAVHVRDLLQRAGLESWVKLSGDKGVHVTVPMQRRLTWNQLGDLARLMAGRLVADSPTTFVDTAAKEKRKRRIFVDWLRNSRGATAVAPWTVRARRCAPVSVPVSWHELSQVSSGSIFTVPAARELIASRRDDPWATMLTSRQRLTDSVIDALAESAPSATAARKRTARVKTTTRSARG